MTYAGKLPIAKIGAGNSAVMHHIMADEIQTGLILAAVLKLGRRKVSQRLLGSGEGCFQKSFANTGGAFVLVVIVGGVVRMGSAAVNMLSRNTGGGADPIPDPISSHGVEGQKIGAIHQNGVFAGGNSHTGNADIVCHAFGQTEFVIAVTGQMHQVIRSKGLTAVAC